MPPKSICTEHCKENHQKPLLMKLFHALDICPASPHKSPSPPQRPLSKSQRGLISLILLLLNSKLSTFSLESNTPDWKSPVSKEALQNLRVSRRIWISSRYSTKLGASSYPPASSPCATGHWEYPQETGHSLGRGHQFLLHAASWGEDPDKSILWNNDTFLQEVVLLKTNKVSIFHCLCRIRHHCSHEFLHHSQSGCTTVKICGC